MPQVVAERRQTGVSVRERNRQRSREFQAAAAELDEIPKIVNPRRRKSCKFDLHRFLRVYFPQSTGLKPFSKDHKSAFERMQIAEIEGGRFLNVFPRGYAKTSASEGATLHATLYGHRKFVPFFGANATAASMSIESIMRELTENDLLADDFPEICYPFRALEGKYQRCRSQTYLGELTHIRAAQDRIVFPHIPDAEGAGAVIMVRSLQGGTRGLKHKRADGTQQRPDLVIIDDPQDDDVARSAHQVEKLLETIKRSILRLGGHDKPIAVFMNATPIEEGDLVAQLLQDPSWQSLVVKMMPKMANLHDEFWMSEYAQTRQTYNPDDPRDKGRAQKAATALYRKKRKKADAGAKVSWKHCYSEGELSAIQHAYNILIDDGPFVFASECQSEPKSRFEASEFLTNTQIRERLSGFERAVVPPDVTTLTSFIDIQNDVLYWMVCGWCDGFTGYIIDYDAFPKQRLPYFTLETINPRLSQIYKNSSPEGAVSQALDLLINTLMEFGWHRADGPIMSIDLLEIDEGHLTQIVHNVIMRSQHRSRILPAKGVADRASYRVPFAEYKKKPGERVGGGYSWRIRTSEMTKTLRHVLNEVNFWKTFVQKRFLVPKGDRGALTLYGRESKEHRLLSDHLTSEYKVRMTNETTGRTVDQWELKPGRPDNHWYDCLVGCASGASVMGIKLDEVLPGDSNRSTKKIKLSELQKRKRS